MNVTVHAPLPNAIFLVLGSQEATLPDVTAEGLVWASEDALIIGGTNDMDGNTTIHVSGHEPAAKGCRSMRCQVPQRGLASG
jgi:hypothetical protein